MATALTAIAQMRIQLSETDESNSRWDNDPHLLFYLNRGRKEFAKKSMALKNIFRQTTSIGATTAGFNEVARYVIDPQVWDIDNLFWDGFEVESEGTGEFEEATATRELKEQGQPYMYRRIGSSIDLFLAPNAAKILEMHSTILPVDLLIGDTETELVDDQLQGAIDYGTAMALMDDDRDPTGYMAKFQANAKAWKKKVHLKGSRSVNVKRRH